MSDKSIDCLKHLSRKFCFSILQKKEKRLQHAMKETEFLRLKRSKLGVDDFEPLKVIGRGAFGEVSSNHISCLLRQFCFVFMYCLTV